MCELDGEGGGELSLREGTYPALIATSFGIFSDMSGLRNGLRGLLSPSIEGYVHSSGRRSQRGADDEIDRRELDDEVAGRREELACEDPNESRRASVGSRGEEDAMEPGRKLS